MTEKLFTLFFDGASKPNPGKAGAGSVLYDNMGIEIWCKSVFLGNLETNNFAEYSGLLLGLEECVKRNIKNLIVKGDSLLVIKQMKGEFKIKSENIFKLFEKSKELQKQFDKIEFFHVYRENNMRADELSNDAFLE